MILTWNINPIAAHVSCIFAGDAGRITAECLRNKTPILPGKRRILFVEMPGAIPNERSNFDTRELFASFLEIVGKSFEVVALLDSTSKAPTYVVRQGTEATPAGHRMSPEEAANYDLPLLGGKPRR